MRTTLQRQRDGRPRPLWYGHAQVDKQERVFSLCRWRGTPPKSGRATDTGDGEFEESRRDAMRMLEEIVDRTKSEVDRQASLERIHAARYGGEKAEAVPLDDVFDQWLKFPRKRKPGKAHAENVAANIRRFVEYCREYSPRARALDAVPVAAVRGFLDAEEARGASPRTCNRIIGMLRGLYRRLAPYAPAARMLADLVMKEEDTQHRAPFTATEVRCLFTVSKARDPLFHALIVCAATSAMRRGDVARLKWSSVDNPPGYLIVKTAKTGETVEIPIFPVLRPIIEEARRNNRGSQYVWPEAAEMYEARPDLLDRRLRLILADAGFHDPRSAASKVPPACPAKPTLPPATMKRAALKAIDNAVGWTEKRRQTSRAILIRYLDGESVKSVAKALDVSVASVSGHVNEVERLAGCAIIRRRAQKAPPAAVKGFTVAEPDPDRPRLKRASLRGWHSFRTTWVTMALDAGVPMELVRKVSGHAAAEVVLKHCFRPGRESFRAALETALPAGLIGEVSRPAKETAAMIPVQEACRIVDTAKSLKEARAALRVLDTARD